MNTTAAIIIKNLILVSIVVLIVATYVTHLLTWPQLQAFQFGLGTFYALFSWIENSNPVLISSLPKERFAYYPGSFFMFRIIKVGLFLMFGIVLMSVPSVIKILYPVCIVIAFSEILVGIVKYAKRLNFVSVNENYVLIGREQIEKIFVNELERVEYRHDIIYLVKKNKKTSVIKVFSVEEHDEFLKRIKNWIIANGIVISNESMERLSKF